MEAYNPEHMSEPESWLELDEQERILLIETYHRVARIKRSQRHGTRRATRDRRKPDCPER